MNERVKCRECEEMILRDEAIEYGKEFICQDCFDEEYALCSDCGCIIPAPESTVINRSRRTERRVCNTCRQEYFHCDVCDEYVTESEIWATDDERSICYNCNADYCTCKDCGTILHYNDARYSSYDDNYYCEDCYEEHDASYIEEYSYKPDPVFLGYTEDNLYLGVELEVDRGTNMHQTTKDLTESFRDIYLKHDGSLGRCGFEIVSHPATLDYHMNELGWDMIDEKTLKTMFDNNSDGAGFMYNHNNKVIIQKGYMTYESFKRALNELEQKIDTYRTPIIFHFRIATHGSVCQGLCHPFPLSHKITVLKHQHTTCNIGIVHNGIIPIKPRKEISDTMEYIASKLTKIERECPEFYKSKKKRKAILAEINSKMAFLDCDGNVYIVG